MSARRLTRRSLLATTAGAVAGGLVRGPVGALAALAGPGPPLLAERRVGDLGPSGATIELGRVADLVGVEWREPAGAGVELRFRSPGGGWSGWVSAGSHGHGPDAPPPAARLLGDPIWTGGADAVQLRARRAL